MTISIVSAIAGAVSSGSTTTTAINTVGKTAARIWVHHETTGVPTITDSAGGNLWVEDDTEGVIQVGDTTLGSVYNTYLRCFKNSGTFNTSASHTFTATLANGYCTVIPAAFAAELGTLRITDWTRISDTSSPYSAPQISPIQDALLVAVGVDDVLATGAFDWSGSSFTKIQAQEGSSSWRASLATRNASAGSYTPSFTDAATGINNTGIGVISITEAFALDTFTGSAGTTLPTHDSNWVNIDILQGLKDVLLDGSGHAYVAVGATYYYYDKSPPDNNYSVSATVFISTTPMWAPGPAIISDYTTDGGDTIYTLWDYSGYWSMRLVAADGLSTTSLGTSTQLPPTTARSVKLKVLGSYVEFSVDGIVLITATLEFSYTSTRPGIFFIGNASGTEWIDNFAAELETIQILTHPENRDSQVGSTATFSVYAPGITEYQWQSAPITDLYSKVPGAWSDISGAVSAEYTTPTSTASDEGKWYRVKCIGTVDTIISEAARLFLRDASIQGIGSELDSSWGFKANHLVSNGGKWLRDTISPEFKNGDIRETVFGHWWWPAVATVGATIKVAVSGVFVDCPVKYFNGSSWVDVVDISTRQSGAWV